MIKIKTTSIDGKPLALLHQPNKRFMLSPTENPELIIVWHTPAGDHLQPIVVKDSFESIQKQLPPKNYKIVLQ